VFHTTVDRAPLAALAADCPIGADPQVTAATPHHDADADPDRLALERVAAGDAEAFAPLVERHQVRLVRLCERLLGDPEAARDAAQEVFLKAFAKAGSYRPRGRVFTWLYRIAVNHCLNRLRRRRIVRFLTLAPAAEADGGATDPPAGGADPETEAAARQRWRRTRAAIAALPPGQRAVVALVRFEGLSYRGAAEALGITEGAVESRLVRAMRTLEAAQESAATGVSQRGDPR
jgi:RNA polymerase sigma-70 factor (ECF subfamily)